jgi:hypothetical protein
MNYRTLAAIVISVACVTAFSAPTADARAKKKIRSSPDTTTLSLDGRNTGRARSCGHDTFVYGSGGAPTGPYCH